MRHALLALLFFLLTTSVIAANLLPHQIAVHVGDRSPMDIYAPRDVTNATLTARLRQEAADRVPPTYRASPTYAQQAAVEVGRAFSEVLSIRALPNLDDTQRLDRLRLAIPGVPDDSLKAALKGSEAQLTQAEQAALAALGEVLLQPISTGVVDVYRDRLDSLLQASALTDPGLRLFARDVARPQVRSNLEIDGVVTERRRQQAAAAVPDQLIKQDEKIVSRDERVTATQLAVLEELGMTGERAGWRIFLGAGLIGIVLVGLVGWYIDRLRPDIANSDRKIVLVGIIGSFTLMLTVLNRSWHPYLIPAALGSMLLAVLLDAKIGLFMAFIIAVGVGAASPTDMAGMLATATGAMVGAYSLGKVETRGAILRAGLLVGGAQALTTLAVFLVRGGPLTASALSVQQWSDVGLGLVSGVVAAVGCIGLLPFFEGTFNVLTPLKLLELSNPNHPLLRRLLMEAPGSYHHTIVVANLCEAAAEAVGADQALARVGAYYHDIGKARRPYFFIENQMGEENPHDNLPPSLSAMIIAGHVKDGVEMARQYKLPEEIISFISEHHGTMLISYFYMKASENGQNEFVLEDDFRYDGPKPRSRETAICMLADGCEATVRVMHQRGGLSPELIEQTVHKIITEREEQGQLTDAPLTLKDLALIEKTFVRVLTGVHHARIEYPSMETAPEANAADDPDLAERRSGQGPLSAGSGGAG